MFKHPLPAEQSRQGAPTYALLLQREEIGTEAADEDHVDAEPLAGHLKRGAGAVELSKSN